MQSHGASGQMERAKRSDGLSDLRSLFFFASFSAVCSGCVRWLLSTVALYFLGLFLHSLI